MLKLKKYVIVNVVSTANLNQFVNIKKFTEFNWGIYDNAIYGGVCGYIKSPEMEGKVTVFSNGKMISMGTKSIQKSINQFNIAKFYLLQENLISDVVLDVKIQNIVSIMTLNLSSSLRKIQKKFKNSIYNPDNFAGLIVKITDKPTCLIFSSGKIIITGAKSEKEILETSLLIAQSLELTCP